MLRIKPLLSLALAFVFLLGLSVVGYAESKNFHTPCFDISLVNNLNLISKTEEKNGGFYRYVFASSNSDNAELQMRVIVSNKKPEAGQSLKDFQVASIGAMSAMFMDAYNLYEYINTPQNQKVLRSKPSQTQLNKNLFIGMTMYFGAMDASFWVTRSYDMTYAFTLVSKNSDETKRKNNLKMITEQLESVKFHSCNQ